MVNINVCKNCGSTNVSVYGTIANESYDEDEFFVCHDCKIGSYSCVTISSDDVEKLTNIEQFVTEKVNEKYNYFVEMYNRQGVLLQQLEKRVKNLERC